MEPEAANVFGILSLIFWSLALVVTVKYLLFIMRLDNDGEGGILALLALVGENGKRRQRRGRGAPAAIEVVRRCDDFQHARSAAAW